MSIKTYSAVVFLFFYNLPLASAAESDRTAEFKCYIESDKRAEIAFYAWPASELNLRMASLIGTTRLDSSNKQYFIKAVEECVTLHDDFTSSKAQALDKATPR